MYEIILGESAWLAIRFSCVEIYPKEAFGWLLGRNENNIWIIDTVAVPQLIDTRGKDLVISHDISDQTWEHFKEAKDLVIGDFHSHPDGASTASKADRENMIELDDGHCFLIVSTWINKKKKMSFNLSGYIHLDGKVKVAKVVKV